MTVYLVLNAVDKFINFRILFSCWAIILMNKPKILVDRTALKMSRNRAIVSGGYFLHELAILEVKDRLSNINRDFQSIAIVTGLSMTWRKAFPSATILSLIHI